MSDGPTPRRRRAAVAGTEERAAAAFGAWREARDRGERADPEDVIRAHPELAAALRRQFAAMRSAERAFGGGAPGATPPSASAAGGSETAWLSGRTLGRWRLGPVLGRGGMGTVFLAQDGDLRAAVKVLHPHLLGRSGFVERFLREAAVGRRVRHPNVVSALDASVEDVDGHAIHYLVLEHVEGRTLRALLDETGRRETVRVDGLVQPGVQGVSEALVRHVGREVARALAAVHAAGAVHRDLKPDNVIISRCGAPGHDHVAERPAAEPQGSEGNEPHRCKQVVKLMDLGVVRLGDEEARLSQTGAFVGSLQYGSPEQFRDPEGVDLRADLHALGVVLYELATGVHPFRAEGFHAVVRRILDETPRPAAELNPQLSPFLEELVAKLLAKERDRRFASADEVARVLEEGEESAWWTERAAEIRGSTRRPLRRIRIARETALYGRETEIAKLRTLYQAAKAGDGQVVLLEGEAGIGKSRLVDEFAGALAQAGEDLNFLAGSYPPGGAATASGAFSTAYREHLGDAEPAIRAALPQTPLLVPAFAALLRGEPAPAGAEVLTKDSLQTVFVHATRTFAAQRPTIVLIDDLHFATDEGRALFAALALAVRGHRVLLVGASRPGLDAKWLGQVERLGNATRLTLPRLSPKDLVRLLADSLRSSHLAEELAGKIAVKSDGNPFFVFEILRGLREGQFLTRKPDGTWATTKLIAEIQVPSSVVDLVQARVSDLGRSDRNVLEVAACLGFEFDAALVGDVLRIEPIPLLQTLGAIEKSHRLVRSVGRRFVFDHHQVMEVLYAGLSEPLREQYHAAVATAMEARSGAASKAPGELDPMLCTGIADHLLKGGQGLRAGRYLDAALKHLEHSYANGPALALIEGALAVPGLLTGSARAAILLRKSTRLNWLGRRDAERAAIDEAMPLADAAHDVAMSAKARRQIGLLMLMLARPAEAEPVLLEAARLARECSDLPMEAYCERDLGSAAWLLSRHADAQVHHERHLAIARETGDRISEAFALGNLGLVLTTLGRFQEARERFERHFEIAHAAGDRNCEAVAALNLGVHHIGLCHFEQAREWFERCRTLSVEVGIRHNESVAIGNLGVCANGSGRLDMAQEHYERYLELSRETGNRMCEAIAMVNLGALSKVKGRFDEARAWLTASTALARESGSRYPEGYGLHDLAHVCAEEGDAVAAEAGFAAALALRREIRHMDGVAGTLITRGALRLRQGREAEAGTDLDEALAIGRELSLGGTELLAATWRARLPGGDVPAALAALAAHEERSYPQGAIEARLNLWTATGDRAHLEEAARRLGGLVAHVPRTDREPMLANVRLHREVVAAAAAAGIPTAAAPD